MESALVTTAFPDGRADSSRFAQSIVSGTRRQQSDGDHHAKMSFPDTHALLRYLYADVSRISQVSADDIVLHPADRALTSPPKPPVRGIEAVQAHEEALIAATGGTLVMDVQTIAANEHFGTVLGTLRAEAVDRGMSWLFRSAACGDFKRGGRWNTGRTRRASRRLRSSSGETRRELGS